VTAPAEDHFLDEELEREADQQGHHRGRADVEAHPAEACGIGEKRPLPSLPEIQDDGRHGSGVEHDQQEGHRGGGRIESEEFLRDDDVGGAGDGEQFRGALHESEEKNLKEGGFHGRGVFPGG